MYYPMINRYDLSWNFGVSIFWFVFVMFIVLIVIRSLRRHEWYEWRHDHNLRHDQDHGSKTDPLDIAKERYAKGDITKAEFDQIKKDLS